MPPSYLDSEHLMTFATASGTPLSSPVPVAARGPLAARAVALLVRAISVTRQRRRLATLDGAALADIGLSRTEALREAHRPFWDLAL